MYNSIIGTILGFLAGVSHSSLTVDLGYSKYTGYHNASSNLNYWRGIRYADAPIGQNRWAAPKPPPNTGANITLTETYPSMCPQTFFGGSPAVGYFDEDCLMLQVVATPNPDPRKPLPVMVYIHGGGYSGGSMQWSFEEMINNNNQGFIFVAIQYRLGAFGFLSSSEVSKFGLANAGLWDQAFALQWVQDHISKFGGDPTRVTISGESAGGGAVMLLAMANKGQWGTKYFQNVIAASPFLPQQWEYNGAAPTTAYESFAKNAGCGNGTVDPTHGSILACLRKADTKVLQDANFNVAFAGHSGEWTFLPVTDYKLIFSAPSQQLKNGPVNGRRLLTGVSFPLRLLL